MTQNARHTFGLCGNPYVNHRGNLGVKKSLILKRKLTLVSEKWFNLHKNWYELSLGGYLKFVVGIFEILIIPGFTPTERVKNGSFSD